MQSDKQLKRWFARYNKLYFQDSLPPDTEIWWEPLSTADGVTCPVYEVSAGHFSIRLDPGIKGFTAYWRSTLLHEMVHVALWPRHPKHQHGKVFNDRMLKLAQDGAFKKLW
jgi:hypothetical protein